MAKPRPEKEARACRERHDTDPAEGASDRRPLTDETGEWEVIGRPFTTAGEENPHAREKLLQEANPTLRLYILAALQTSAWRSELIRLRWADVDMKLRTVTLRATKNCDSRSVPMTETLRETLHGLPRPL